MRRALLFRRGKLRLRGQDFEPFASVAVLPNFMNHRRNPHLSGTPGMILTVGTPRPGSVLRFRPEIAGAQTFDRERFYPTISPFIVTPSFFIPDFLPYGYLHGSEEHP